MDVEVLSPDQGADEARARFVHAQSLGFLGAALALLTMFAALGFGVLILFGTTLAVAAAVYVVWPLVFTPAFTHWIFGTPRLEFWKVFLLLLAAGFVMKLFRR